ncbi:MAG: hypothetical protein IJ875_04115 [Solobacterium sp.]|nr:hypothetical protein [Solobacterium sp.]
MNENKQLTDNLLENVTGGEMSGEEELEFLDQFIDDPDLQRAWTAAIHYLYNYPGYNYYAYKNILNVLVPWAIENDRIMLSEREFTKICLEAYTKFHFKIHH